MKTNAWVKLLNLGELLYSCGVKVMIDSFDSCQKNSTRRKVWYLKIVNMDVICFDGHTDWCFPKKMKKFCNTIKKHIKIK